CRGGPRRWDAPVPSARPRFPWHTPRRLRCPVPRLVAQRAPRALATGPRRAVLESGSSVFLLAGGAVVNDLAIITHRDQHGTQASFAAHDELPAGRLDALAKPSQAAIAVAGLLVAEPAAVVGDLQLVAGHGDPAGPCSGVADHVGRQLAQAPGEDGLV